MKMTDFGTRGEARVPPPHGSANVFALYHQGCARFADLCASSCEP